MVEKEQHARDSNMTVGKEQMAGRQAGRQACMQHGNWHGEGEMGNWAHRLCNSQLTKQVNIETLTLIAAQHLSGMENGPALELVTESN